VQSGKGTGNRMTGQRFIMNQDCNDTTHAAPPGRAQEWIRDWFRRSFAAGGGVLVADVALPDVVETKDTPTGEWIGARFGDHPPEKEVSAGGVPLRRNPWYRTNRELSAQGTDVLHLACEEGRKAGGIVLAGMRMSDAHHGPIWQPSSDSPLFAQFVMDHPEWTNTWDGDEVMCALYGRRDATLNYAVPEVQAHRLQILRELATSYDIDGLELNWMRWCRHFPAGTQRAHLDDLTDFVRQVRAMLDEVARQKGVDRPILGHRVPATLEEALNIGCDVATWARAGCADFLAPMDFLFNDINLRADDFVAATAGTGCLVYPAFGSTKYSFSPVYAADTTGLSPEQENAGGMCSLDEFRATAANWYAWGAAGGSCFNMYMWQPAFQEFFTAAIGILSDPQKALAGPRHYVYLPVWQNASLPEHHGHRAPTGRHNAQRLVFSPETAGYRQAFCFRMADGRHGEKLDGVLRFRLYGALPADGFAVDINGVPVRSSQLRVMHLPEGEPFDTPQEGLRLPGACFTWPPHLRCEIALADCPAFRGDNELGIRLKGLSPDRPANPVLEALEVLVRG
jgi:hypothetical protein